MDRSVLFDNLRKCYSLISKYNGFNYMIPPIRYFLELTYRCNLNCPFCFITESRIKEELSTKEWIEVIKQIPLYAFISIVAGEVMLRKDFMEILEKSCKQTMGKVSIVTNGLLLDEEKIKKFIQYKMLLISVSIDGFEVNHDRIRNKEGLYEKIYKNLVLLKE